LTEAYPSEAPSPTAPRASAALVIVNYRTPELVERCVRSALAGADRWELEIVIVDNGSGDGSAERLRASLPSATVLAEPENRGFAAGVNAGMRACETEFAIVLNPDTEALPGSLELLLDRLRGRPCTGVAAPLLVDRDGGVQVSTYRRFPGLFTLFVELCIPIGYALVHVPRLHPYAMSPAAIARGERPAHVCGAALAIRRSAYRQAGPLDEGFFLYLEETEWQRRVARAGWDIELVKDARVLHLVRAGGEAALAPSPHFVTSAVTYLTLKGISRGLVKAVLLVALGLSWATLSLIALLPAKRSHARLQARAYRALFAELARA